MARDFAPSPDLDEVKLVEVAQAARRPSLVQSVGTQARPGALLQQMGLAPAVQVSGVAVRLLLPPGHCRWAVRLTGTAAAAAEKGTDLQGSLHLLRMQQRQHVVDLRTVSNVLWRHLWCIMHVQSGLASLCDMAEECRQAPSMCKRFTHHASPDLMDPPCEKHGNSL
jgi:hypothetical protein